jgi:hypothetical protein
MNFYNFTQNRLFCVFSTEIWWFFRIYSLWRDKVFWRIKGLFGLQPSLTLPIFWSLTAIGGLVWISAKGLQPNQFFGHTVQISRPRVGQMLAAELFANFLACWQG